MRRFLWLARRFWFYLRSYSLGGRCRPRGSAPFQELATALLLLIVWRAVGPARTASQIEPYGGWVPRRVFYMFAFYRTLAQISIDGTHKRECFPRLAMSDGT